MKQFMKHINEYMHKAWENYSQSMEMMNTYSPNHMAYAYFPAYMYY